MATRVIEESGDTIHEHYHDSDGNNSTGLVIGLVLILLLAFLFLYYGLPRIKSVTSPTVNVPGQVDVNVHSSK